MGHFANVAMKAAIGWPAPGWAPPYGQVTDTIAATVNQNTAMGVGAFTAGIRLIAEDIASMPLFVYERLDKGKRKAPEHPAYDMLHDRPNPEMTSMVFQETGIAHMYSWGDWFAEKELNAVGVPVALWPLRPDKMVVERDRDTGKRIYKYTLPNGQGVIIPQARMFHVPGWGFDGLRGYSRIWLMRRALEGSIVASDYGLRTLANDARPGTTIKHPQQLSPAAKKNIADSWDERHAGLTNAQRTAVLDEGMDLVLMGFSPEDAQFLQSKQWSTVEVAQGLRLAPHKLSDMSRATFSNIEESNIDHVVGTLGPPVTRIDQQMNKDIIGPGRFFAEHLMDGLMKGRFLDRVQGEVQLRQNGLATGEELRALENRNPLTDADKADLLIPLSSVPASSYDEHGQTMAQRINNAGILARAGYDPAAALISQGIAPIAHTGFLPVTVQAEQAIPAKDGEAETKGDVHLHIEKGAIANETTVVLPDTITIPEAPAPVVNVAAPIVNVAPPDLRAVTDGIAAMKDILETPETTTILRDPETKAIVGSDRRRVRKSDGE